MILQEAECFTVEMSGSQTRVEKVQKTTEPDTESLGVDLSNNSKTSSKDTEKNYPLTAQQIQSLGDLKEKNDHRTTMG